MEEFRPERGDLNEVQEEWKRNRSRYLAYLSAVGHPEDFDNLSEEAQEKVVNAVMGVKGLSPEEIEQAVKNGEVPNQARQEDAFKAILESSANEKIARGLWSRVARPLGGLTYMPPRETRQ